MANPTTADAGNVVVVISVDTVLVIDTTEVTVVNMIVVTNWVFSTGTSGELKFFDKPCKKNILIIKKLYINVHV